MAPVFDPGTEDGYQFFLRLGPLRNANRYFGGDNPYWDADITHTTYDDYWKARALWRHLRNIHCAVLTVGGWFDAEDLMGALRTHRTIAENNPGIFNGLVMGPGSTAAGPAAPGGPSAASILRPTPATITAKRSHSPFEQHLKDQPGAPLAAATVFETGTNVWRRYPAWPPAAARPRTLYFRENGGLSFAAPGATEAGSDHYVSDPNRPVPYIGYPSFGMPQEYMVSDQRFASERPDVLVSPPRPSQPTSPSPARFPPGFSSPRRARTPTGSSN